MYVPAPKTSSIAVQSALKLALLPEVLINITFIVQRNVNPPYNSDDTPIPRGRVLAARWNLTLKTPLSKNACRKMVGEKKHQEVRWVR